MLNPRQAYLAVIIFIRIFSGSVGIPSEKKDDKLASSVLGDEFISDKSKLSFFNEIDGNSNGHISIDELNLFAQETGGRNLDETSEIRSAAVNAMMSVDGNSDALISPADLYIFFLKQGTIFIIIFVMHHVLLSSLMDIFLLHSINVVSR